MVFVISRFNFSACGNSTEFRTNKLLFQSFMWFPNYIRAKLLFAYFCAPLQVILL